MVLLVHVMYISRREAQLIAPYLGILVLVTERVMVRVGMLLIIVVLIKLLNSVTVTLLHMGIHALVIIHVMDMLPVHVIIPIMDMLPVHVIIPIMDMLPVHVIIPVMDMFSVHAMLHVMDMLPVHVITLLMVIRVLAMPLVIYIIMQRL